MESTSLGKWNVLHTLEISCCMGIVALCVMQSSSLKISMDSFGHWKGGLLTNNQVFVGACSEVFAINGFALPLQKARASLMGNWA